MKFSTVCMWLGELLSAGEGFQFPGWGVEAGPGLPGRRKKGSRASAWGERITGSWGHHALWLGTLGLGPHLSLSRRDQLCFLRQAWPSLQLSLPSAT